MGNKWPLGIFTAAVLAILATMPVAETGLLGGRAVAAESEEDTEAPAGRTLFVESKCNQCHPVAAQGIERTSTSDKLEGPDLSEVGDEHMADWIVRFVKREETLDGEKHKKPYKGTDEELEEIAAWLCTLHGESDS